jgi:hypothetical protein
MNLINQSAFDKQIAAANRMMSEMIEESICECLAWRMFGIDANFYWMQGEFVVEVNFSKTCHLTNSIGPATLFGPLNLKG